MRAMQTTVPKHPNGRVSVGTIRVARGPETLAGVLREGILSGDIIPGAALAPERELVEQTGLSRATVREALRILETEGLVASRPGRNGGARVRPVSDEGVARAVQVFIRGLRIDEPVLRETREVIEGAAVRLAAERRTAADLAAIKDISRRLEAATDDIHRLAEENARWHVAVAEASRNPLLTAFMKSIATAISHPNGIDDPALALSPEGRVALVKAHRRVTEAIVARDPDTAERRMLRHLRAYPAEPASGQRRNP
jgi:GntR family transcriptional regulator, transcriptional repressor for pyruvate dehydrogenase complex